MDLTVLHLAVPRSASELRPSSSQLLWIIDIYGFMVAGLPRSRWARSATGSAGGGCC